MERETGMPAMPNLIEHKDVGPAEQCSCQTHKLHASRVTTPCPCTMRQRCVPTCRCPAERFSPSATPPVTAAHTNHSHPLLLLTWLDGKVEPELLLHHKLLQVCVVQRLPYLPVVVLPKRVEVLAERSCPRVCSHHHQTKELNATCEEDWVLWDDAQPRPQVVEPDGCDVDAIHRDGPRCWLDKPEQRQGQAALASSRAANNAKLLASLDGEGDVLPALQ